MPNVIDPFNQDVDSHGAYRYTDLNRPSCAYANGRFTQVILDASQLEGMRVVDIGCGDGTYSEALATEGRAESVLGIDPAAAAIDRATHTYSDNPTLDFRTAVAADLVQEGLRFDVAVVRGVIHHVADPAAEIASILQLADRAFFLEPNGWNPVLKLIERASPYHRAHEERSYLIQRYHRWVAEAGGQVESAFFFGLVPMFCPNWMVGLGSALEPIIEKLPALRSMLCGQIGVLAIGPERE